jgi:hypothetical protein
LVSDILDMAQLEGDPEADVHGTLETQDSSSDDTFEKSPGVNADKPTPGSTWNWDDDPNNPYNWSIGEKAQQVLVIGWAAFTT